MAYYDLEEQEQLAELKSWWKQWGALLLIAIALALAAFAAYQVWSWYKRDLAAKAATEYAAITKALQALADGEDIAYVGAGGSVDFDDNGDVKTPMAVWRFTEEGDETVEIVPPSEIETE